MTFLVKDVMSKQLVTIEAETSVSDAAKQMTEKQQDYLLVLRAGQLEGLVTDGDIIREVLAKDLNPQQVKIADVMTTPLITIDPDMDLSRAAELMKAKNVRRLPVVREGILYGILTTRHITDHFNEYLDKTIREILIHTSPLSF